MTKEDGTINMLKWYCEIPGPEGVRKRNRIQILKDTKNEKSLRFQAVEYDLHMIVLFLYLTHRALGKLVSINSTWISLNHTLLSHLNVSLFHSDTLGK